MRRMTWALVLVLLAVSPAAFAQVATKPVVGHFALGYVEPMGTTGDFVDPGWNLSGGATMHFNPKRPLGLRVDFGYSWFDATHQVLDSANSNTQVRVDDGYASVWNLDFDAMYEFGGKGHVGGYIAAGIGAYSRYWQLTREALVSGIYCDPWWGWCYPYTTVGQVISDSDRLTKLGYNVALAITFPLPSGSQIYVEGCYHWMDTENATEYLPIVLGWRW